jgi:hypothetical protein
MQYIFTNETKDKYLTGGKGGMIWTESIEYAFALDDRDCAREVMHALNAGGVATKILPIPEKFWQLAVKACKAALEYDEALKECQGSLKRMKDYRSQNDMGLEELYKRWLEGSRDVVDIARTEERYE